MSDTNKNTYTSPNEDSTSPSGGLLGEILWAWKTHSSEAPEVDLLSDFISETRKEEKKSSSPSQEWIKKPQKKSMNALAFLRMVWAILLVAFIFFGAFLAYIVFNPGQASFFISFGINPGDIAHLLRQLVSAIFGVVTFILSIVWIVYLFKAILTKKEYKKKKTISIIFSVFFGILLFSEITLWAFLVQKINATDYENPNGGVVVYDNEKFISERFKGNAQMNNFDNLIGPLELKFDLKSDANFVGKIMDIESYKIDFDGAKCQWRDSSIVDGVNAEQSIICIFDQAKVFRPTGIYEGLDRVTHKPKTISMNFHTIQIAWVVDVKQTKTSITYDASRLTSLGKINWYTEKGGDAPVSTNAIFSITMENDAQILCLNISSGTNCDKLFIIPKISDSSITAKIVHEQDKENPFLYSFHLEDKIVKNGEITGYKWVINDNTISTKETCTYTFSEYGDVRVTLFLNDSTGNITELHDNFSMLHPLEFTKGSHTESLLKVTDTSLKSLLDNTYSKSLRAYYITDVVIPMNVQFDATDVKVENYGYELVNVEWDFDGDSVFEKTGTKVRYELIEEKRYTFAVRYTFTDTEKNITSLVEEKIIFEPAKKDIALALSLTQDSEYAPATVHVDGSASIPKTGTITKFMYDFGEGKWPIEGDAIQDYRYNFPGEYTITFTVVRDDGVKEFSTRKIVIKDAPKQIAVNMSVSSGIVGKPIDFDTNGTVGQIETYSWDFWDGTTSEESNPTHTYQEKGKYIVKITVTYTDRTVRSTDREITVVE